MKPNIDDIIREIINIQQAAQLTLDQSKDDTVNGLLKRAIDDLTMVQQNIYIMSEKEIADVLERTVDFVNNCGATFEIVS
jgi:translation elongation factor EF-Ts